jgi:hypothetical protein
LCTWPCGWQSASSGRRKHVIETDSSIELSPHQITYSVDRFGTVVSGVDVDPEWSRSLGHPDHPNDGPRYFSGILIGGYEVSELLGDSIHQAPVEELIGSCNIVVVGARRVAQVGT